MPTYKLYYFNGRGRAETARMLFALAGQDYEDIRVGEKEWADFKPKTPFGQLPLLEVDGETIAQSNAFSRLLAKRFGYAGKTDLEAARVDMVVDTLEDAVKPLERIWSCKNETEKAELKKKYQEETLVTYLSGLEKTLCKNNGGDGFFVGNDVTYADLSFVNLLAWVPMMGMSVPWDKYLKLQALTERVNQVPKIAEWVQKRPKTEF